MNVNNFKIYYYINNQNYQSMEPEPIINFFKGIFNDPNKLKNAYNLIT